MRNLAAVLLAAVVFVGPALADTTENIDAGWGFIEPDGGPMWNGSRDVLYDNGPYFNSAGTGYGGADESILQDQSLGMGTYGFGHQHSLSYVVADDFMVPDGETWTVEGITFFGYQTGSSTTSTITGVYFEIRDDLPPGGTVLYGDLVTNQLMATGWSNAYRTLESSPGATNRPIMANDAIVSPSLELSGGQYWICWNTDGSLSSGPWAPPIAILDVGWTGDGLQSLDGGATYNPVYDGGSGDPQGFPFIISGFGGTTEADATSWGAVKALFK